ncbi:MAG TPA: DUF2207 domain-containing protein [Symbiobacteriaceae bacterium]|nr:DUF2207 domain-containing protein [Symbiobacteriaceae bacterium]
MSPKYPLLLALLLLLLLPGTALAKDWTIPHARIDARLNANGHLTITETRTYRFDGDFSHLWQVIEYPTRSHLRDLTLTGQSGRPYRESNSAEPGTFSLSKASDGTRVDWYIPAGTKEATFVLTYTVENAARLHQDGAELYWDLVGGEWEKGTGLLEVLLDLPAPPLDAWAGGTAQPIKVHGSQLSLTVADLPSKHSVSIRALLPPNAVTAAGRPSRLTLHQVRAEAGREPDTASRALQLAWTLAAICYGVWFYARRVRRPDPGRLPDDEKPAPLSPAQVAQLHQRTLSDGLLGTLADLSNRGALEVQRTGDGDWRFVRTDREAGLATDDEAALDAFFPPDRAEVTLSEWKQLQSRLGRIAQRLTKWWESVRKSLPRDWFVPHSYWIYLVAAVGAVITFATYPGPLRWAAGATTPVLVILGLAQRRCTDEGYRQLALWRRERTRFAPAEVAFGLALGIKGVTAGFDLRWSDDTQVAFSAVFSDGGAGGDGGGGGGDGGGGGGAE